MKNRASGRTCVRVWNDNWRWSAVVSYVRLSRTIWGHFSLSLRNLARQSGSGIKTIRPKQSEQVSSDRTTDRRRSLRFCYHRAMGRRLKSHCVVGAMSQCWHLVGVQTLIEKHTAIGVLHPKLSIQTPFCFVQTILKQTPLK